MAAPPRFDDFRQGPFYHGLARTGTRIVSGEGTRAWLRPRPGIEAVVPGDPADGDLPDFGIVGLKQVVQALGRLAGIDQRAQLGLARPLVGLARDRRAQRRPRRA